MVRIAWKSLAPALAALTLAACASGEDPAFGPAPAAAPQPSFRLEGGDLELGALPPRALNPGECGIFLWSQPPRTELIFFSGDDGRGAVMMLNGVETRFARTEIGGEAFLNQYSEQVFLSSDGARLQMSVTTGEATESGLSLPRGVLRLKQPDGWELVAPVTGLAGCRED